MRTCRRCLLVGGLAVGAHGWPRATKDVDFLVDESAFEHRPGGLVLLKVPFQANGVPIDSLAPAEDEPFLAEERDCAAITISARWRVANKCWIAG